MNISKEKLISEVNTYVEKINEVFKGMQDEFTKKDLHKIKVLTIDMIDFCADGDISLEDELELPFQFLMLYSVKALYLSYALHAFSDKAKTVEEVKIKLAEFFANHMTEFREMCRAYHHKILENREVN